jgi:hypothetical protein
VLEEPSAIHFNAPASGREPFAQWSARRSRAESPTGSRSGRERRSVVHVREIAEARIWLMADWATKANAAAAQATLRRDRLPQPALAVRTSAFVASSWLLLDELSLRARHPSRPSAPPVSLRTEGRGTDLASAPARTVPPKRTRSGSTPGLPPPLSVITRIPAKTRKPTSARMQDFRGCDHRTRCVRSPTTRRRRTAAAGRRPGGGN